MTEQEIAQLKAELAGARERIRTLQLELAVAQDIIRRDGRPPDVETR